MQFQKYFILIDQTSVGGGIPYLVQVQNPLSGPSTNRLHVLLHLAPRKNQKSIFFQRAGCITKYT